VDTASKPIHAGSKASSKNTRAKSLKEMTGKEREEWDALVKNYAKGRQLVSYGSFRQLETPIGEVTIKTYPSGSQYVLRSDGSQEKLTPEWFKKIQRIAEQMAAKEQAEKDNEQENSAGKD
jgi:hypothetical protein